MLGSLEKKIELKATLNNFEQFMSFINSELANSQIEESDKIKILTSCEEIIVNIINYAYKEGEGYLGILIQNNSRKIIITLIDNGVAFNPLDKVDADITLPLEERNTGGLGILMVKKLMDDVKYEYQNQQNRLTIVKYISNFKT